MKIIEEKFCGWAMYSRTHGCYFGRYYMDKYGAYNSPYDYEVRSLLTKTKEEIIKIFNECEDPFYGGKHTWGFEPVYVTLSLEVKS